MSKRVEEGKRVVTVEELLARASELKEYMDLLQSQMQLYTSQLGELELVKNTLENLPLGSADTLIVLDRLNMVFIPAVLDEKWFENVFVNIGRNYYIRTNKDEAHRIVNDRIIVVRRILDNLRRQYQIVLSEYNVIQQILAKVYAQIQEKTREAGQVRGQSLSGAG
jgi:prefoldin alpha subunit